MTRVESSGCGEVVRVGAWRADRAACELSGPAGVVRIEPKVMDLLFLLAARPGDVVSRETILATLWPGMVVGEDALARTVSKLRQALDDDARAPRYVDTIAKRGYRLRAPVSTAGGGEPPRPPPVARAATVSWPLATCVLVVVVAAAWLAWPGRPDPSAAPSAATDAGADRVALLARADDAYFQFARGDNEAAIELYQRVLGLRQEDPVALAGLANALVQRALRWPQSPDEGAIEFRTLGDALASGYLQREPQRAQVERARQLADRAIVVEPTSAAAHKAAGFAASAQGRFDDALAAYARSVELDPDAWGAMINIGDVLGLSGREAEALPWFERAYAAMERTYARNPAQVRPWQAPLGVLVATRLQADGDRAAAEGWYRRVLAQAPLDVEATRGLAALLRAAGDVQQADRLCLELRQRTPGDCGE